MSTHDTRTARTRPAVACLAALAAVAAGYSFDPPASPARTGCGVAHAVRTPPAPARGGPEANALGCREGRAGRAPLSRRRMRLYVQGDSLMVGTDPYLKRLLPRWSIAQDAKARRSLPQGLARLRRAAAGLPPVVIIGLGTNDDANYPASFAADARAVLRIAGPRRCVIWVDVYRPLPGDRFERFNRILAALRSSHRNLLIAHWSTLAARHPEWFTRDVVHPVLGGYAARARIVAASVRRCPRTAKGG